MDQQTYRRRSIRLKGYDYSQAGAYFVTIVTQGRERLFGEIVDEAMQLNQYGEIVREEWERTSLVRPRVEIGAYTIMPNHVHGILIFHDRVEATRRVAPTRTLQPDSLGAIMAQFKSIVTKRINAIRNSPQAPVWQGNYYEHIIRNDNEMARIWSYIESNPARWGLGKEIR